MKIEITSAENGWVIRSISQHPEDLDKIEVVEEGNQFDEMSEQRDARKLLWALMDNLGFHFSKHGPKLYIEIRDPDGKVIDE